MGDVIADRSVAARERQFHLSVFISDRSGDAVDLVLHHPLNGLALEQFFGAVEVGLELLATVRVVDRKHRHGMFDLDQVINRRVADTLRR